MKDKTLALTLCLSIFNASQTACQAPSATQPISITYSNQKNTILTNNAVTTDSELEGIVTLGTPEIENIPLENSTKPLTDLVTEYRKKHHQYSQPVLFIEKSQRILSLYLCTNPTTPNPITYPPQDNRCTEIKTYPVSLGYNPKGDKVCQKDYKTPEGTFYLTKVKLPGKSKFHAAMQISYPSPQHVYEGKDCKDKGVITQEQVRKIKQAYDHCTEPPQNTAAGNLIQIHGMGGNPNSDWTWGCIAPSSEAMDELLDPKLALIDTGCNFTNGKRIEKTKVIIVP